MQTSPWTVLIVTTSIEEIVPMADDVLEPLVSQHRTGRAQFNLCSLFTLLFGDTEWRLSRLQISSKRFDLTRRHRETEGQFICFTSSPALNCSDNFSTPTTTKHTHTDNFTAMIWEERPRLQTLTDKDNTLLFKQQRCWTWTQRTSSIAVMLFTRTTDTAGRWMWCEGRRRSQEIQRRQGAACPAWFPPS